jgi:MYXO-CTERM domain-containing protein
MTFEVEPSSALSAWWRRVRTFFENQAPWSYVVPALLLGLGALVLARRRFRVTVVRRA